MREKIGLRKRAKVDRNSKRAEVAQSGTAPDQACKIVQAGGPDTISLNIEMGECQCPPPPIAPAEETREGSEMNESGYLCVSHALDLYSLCVAAHTQFRVLSDTLFDNFGNIFQTGRILFHFIVAERDVVGVFAIIALLCNGVSKLLSGFVEFALLIENAPLVDDCIRVFAVALAQQGLGMLDLILFVADEHLQLNDFLLVLLIFDVLASPESVVVLAWDWWEQSEN